MQILLSGKIEFVTNVEYKNECIVLHEKEGKNRNVENSLKKGMVQNTQIQGGPPKSIHFCWATARPVSTRERQSVSQIKRTLQDFRTRGWRTRSDNFGAR